MKPRRATLTSRSVSPSTICVAVLLALGCEPEGSDDTANVRAFVASSVHWGVAPPLPPNVTYFTLPDGTRCVLFDKAPNRKKFGGDIDCNWSSERTRGSEWEGEETTH